MKIEQITKADRNAYHALCGKANPAPRYGGLIPPLYVRMVETGWKKSVDTYCLVD
jgi:hypothetical protein